MSNPVRHHVLPRFYLGGFTSDLSIWVYDRKKVTTRKESLKNASVINDYYTYADNGAQKYDLEQFLAKVESRAAHAIRRLSTYSIIDQETIGNLSTFIAFLLTRVPAFEKDINEVGLKTVRHIIKRDFSSPEAIKSELEKIGITDMDTQALFDFISNESNYKIDVLREFSLGLMASLTFGFAKLLGQMTWTILHPPANSEFITSDNPFIIRHTRHTDQLLGLALPGAEKIVPLSRKLCLLAGDSGGGFRHAHIDKTTTRKINLLVAELSSRCIYGGNDYYLRFIAERARLQHKQIPSRFALDDTIFMKLMDSTKH